jgi:hypothetical protein
MGTFCIRNTAKLAVLLLAGCVAAAATATDEELAQMFADDQESRTAGSSPDPAADDRRRFRVLELIGEGRVTTPEAKYHAAMILQHTPRIWIGELLSSQASENYLLAHYLAKSAAEAGHEPARWLAAAAYDRYLVSIGQPQKYGTQFSLNRETGRMEFDPVDPGTTDEERARWNVPPIAETMEKFEKRHPKADER